MPHVRRFRSENSNIKIKNINITTMNGSASFNTGDFVVIDPVSSQNTTTENNNSSNNSSTTTTNQRGGAGAFNTGNNNKFVSPFNRINDLGSG
ncbi:hypothetical protein KP806_18475 [Paenibacillus sp. N4]|uniref:hypothetical protein n=1 Tax=Paenibacillus vietnamensis TaxID=2590547 RepID=UPI001CD17D75|nr:hypothetical protein [Paenibacillus vietnamensis]MCA0757051.1 hypothetical protein [Paenibacillus vietnamensis]